MCTFIYIAQIDLYYTMTVFLQVSNTTKEKSLNKYYH